MRSLVHVFMIGIGFACGGLLIPWLHLWIYGATDPFANGWPMLLQTVAFLGSFICVLGFRFTAVSGLTITLGLTLGVIWWMMASGQAEYPASSIIAILLHSFIPSALGSAFGYFILSRRKPHSVDINRVDIK